MWRVLWIACVCFAGLSGLVRAACLDVPAAWPSVGAALQAAQAGDSVRLAPGTYVESGLFLPSGVRLLSASNDPSDTILDAQGVERILRVQDAASGTKVQGLTLRNGWARTQIDSPYDISGGGIYVSNSQLELRDCLFEGGHGSYGGGVAVRDDGTVNLLRCEFRGNTANYGSGLSAQNDVYLTLQNCSFHDHVAGYSSVVDFEFGATGLLVSTEIVDNRGSGLYAVTGGHVTARHCTLARNSGDGAWIYDSEGSFTKCLVTHNGRSLYCSQHNGSYSISVSCSNIFGNEEGDWVGCLEELAGVNQNRSVDPLYCDWEAGDYRLAADSPCLAANGGCSPYMGAWGEGCAEPDLHVDFSAAPLSGFAPLAVTFSSLCYPADSLEWEVDGDGVVDSQASTFTWSYERTGLYPVKLVLRRGEEADSLLREDWIRVLAHAIRVPEDLPSIGQALNLAMAGDTVLVACGDYQENHLNVRAGVSLLGAGEGEPCVRIHCPGGPSLVLGDWVEPGAPAKARRLWLQGTGNGETSSDGLLVAGGSLEHCLVSGYALAEQQPLILLTGPSDTLRACTLAGNVGQGGALLRRSSDNPEDRLRLDHLLLAWNPGFSTLLTQAGPLEVVGCDLHGNTADDWGGELSPYQNQFGNQEADPGFCDPQGGDFHLALGSPCAPGGSPDGGQVGALGASCESSLPWPLITLAPRQGQAPLTVEFSALAAQELTDYQWDFENDGAFDATGSPQEWTYQQPGTYSVRLRASNPAGWSENLLSACIQVGGRVIRVPEDASTVALALAQAQVGDSVDLACDTYFERDLTLPAGVVLRSRTGSPECATLDGEDLGRLLSATVGQAPGAAVLGLTLRRGRALAGEDGDGGAVHHESGVDLTLRHCRFEDNRAQRGGALYGEYHLTLDSCSFVDNHADQGGGAYFYAVSINRIRDCVFQGNEAASTGGAACLYYSSLRACEFTQNLAHEGGGALWAKGSSIRDCLFQGNASPYWGSAVYNPYDIGAASISVSGCLFTGQTGSESLMLSNSSGISGSTLARNETGGVYFAGLEGGISNCLVAENGGEMPGVAVLAANAVIEAECNDVWGNSGGNYGGILAEMVGVDGNLEEDPLFCDSAAGDFALLQESPGRPEHNPCGEWMGVLRTACGVSVEEPALPRSLSLGPAHPNPFNPRTTLDLWLPQAGPVRAELYNLAGQRVRLLVDERRPAGLGVVQVPGQGLASGLYLVKVEAPGGTATGKILLVK